MARFGESEKLVVKMLKPFVIGMVVILFLVEIITVLAMKTFETMTTYDNFINIYRGLLGLDVLILSTFFSFYGLRIMSYLKQTMIQNVSKRTLRVNFWEAKNIDF